MQVPAPYYSTSTTTTAVQILRISLLVPLQDPPDTSTSPLQQPTKAEILPTASFATFFKANLKQPPPPPPEALP
jgi:hypothetical protein